MRTTKTRYRLPFLAICSFVVSVAGAADAATGPPAHSHKTTNEVATLHEIEVTGTRIIRPGFVAPTPVTTVTASDLSISGYTEVGQALADLPMAKPSLTPLQTSSGEVYQGFNIPDLRGLGSSRTLVLIDGERPVWESFAGVDLNSIPISLVKRVDIVTGGASAAYGSDAVAGVINIVLDNNFVGERADLQYGEDTQGYGGNDLASVAVGQNFGPDDRGHFMIAGEWTHSDLITASRVPQFQNNMIQNPAFAAGNGQPEFILAPNYNYSNLSAGGLIISGPLAGTAFGPNGTPYAFKYGADANATYMSGGDPEASPVIDPGSAIQAESDHKNVYGRVNYEISSEVNLDADFLYTNSSSDSPYGTDNTNIIGPFTIQSTNAFLPSSIASQMTADGITSFELGRSNSDFGTVTNDEQYQTYWGSVGANGVFGRNWTWKVFYNHGVTNSQLSIGPMQITSLLQESVDSILSGGQPVCASTALKNPVTGASCVPVDLFGSGSPSASAIAFFSGYGQGYWAIKQNEASGQVQGEPFSTWAGPVSTAAGVEWRTNSLDLYGGPLDSMGAFDRQNFPSIAGQYSVTEGFAETVVPLLRGLPALQKVDFNGAVRESHYSTSGNITSWKLGLTDKASPDFLLRGTYSHDIRAPNVEELFLAQGTDFGTVTDPEHGNATVPIKIILGGNPHLQPEQASTLTYGVVFTPAAMRGFALSVDWYRIDMDGAITAQSAQNLVNYCAAGVSDACANVIRNSSGTIVQVNSDNINLDRLTTSGLDVEASDTLDLNRVWSGVPGSLGSHLLLTYVDRMQGTDGTNVYEGVGILSGQGIAPSQLRWRATLTENYQWRRFEGYVRARFLSGGIYQDSVTLSDNNVGGQYYLDLGASYFLDDDRHFQVYGNVVNVLDRSPPTFAAAPEVFYSGFFYDIFGTTFNVGVRAQF